MDERAKMKRMGLLLLVLFSVSAGGSLARMQDCRAADAPPAEGAVLPDFKLPVSPLAEENQYLGVGQAGSFGLDQVGADIVILEIFNMYCPHCQKEAPNINQLYGIISGRGDHGGKIKILGIGAGNSPFEVKTFKKAFDVPFPLFPDEDFAVHHLLGEVRTPYFVVIRINPDGSHKVLYSRVGSIGEPQKFLQLILNESESK
jgi:peroxiredoxin